MLFWLILGQKSIKVLSKLNMLHDLNTHLVLKKCRFYVCFLKVRSYLSLFDLFTVCIILTNNTYIKIFICMKIVFKFYIWKLNFDFRISTPKRIFQNICYSYFNLDTNLHPLFLWTKNFWKQKLLKHELWRVSALESFDVNWSLCRNTLNVS